MGAHTLGRLNCYSNFKSISQVELYRGDLHERKAIEQPTAACTTQAFWSSSDPLEIDRRNCKWKQAKKSLFSPRAAHGAENGYAAAAWATKPTVASGRSQSTPKSLLGLEALIERVIFNCRFITLLAVVGSLGGSILCFIQGCRFVTESFIEYVHASLLGKDSGHVILLLVEAIDIFLVATVMLIFGMGVYELFVNTIGLQRKDDTALKFPRKNYTGSNLFGLFQLQERPLWLEIRSLHELKTKVGHVIVMILLVGIFEKSKMVPIITGLDLLCYAASILMCAGCLLLLSKLHVTK